MVAVSREGHDIAGTTANRPTNLEPGMLYHDTSLNVLLVCNASGVLVPVTATGAATVAAAGTNQGTAAALTAGVTNFVTGADGAKGVILPAPTLGKTVVYNSSASALWIYPASGGTINGASANAGVLIRGNSVAEFYQNSSTAWSAHLSGQNTSDSIGGSTAAAGTTTSDAGVLPAGTASFYPTTGANGTTGVRINAADNVAGRRIYVGNGVSNAVLKIYPPTGGTINGASADAAYSTVSGKGALLVCSAAGTWYALG